jgi:hypothetical protein
LDARLAWLLSSSGDPKVTEQGFPVLFSEQNIRGLQVAVDDSGLVGNFKSLGNLPSPVSEGAEADHFGVLQAGF